MTKKTTEESRGLTIPCGSRNAAARGSPRTRQVRRRPYLWRLIDSRAWLQRARTWQANCCAVAHPETNSRPSNQEVHALSETSPRSQPQRQWFGECFGHLAVLGDEVAVSFGQGLQLAYGIWMHQRDSCPDVFLFLQGIFQLRMEMTASFVHAPSHNLMVGVTFFG